MPCVRALSRRVRKASSGPQRTLHVTPDAVSRHVKRLETELGTSLFERHAHGVRLTAAARIGFERAQWALRIHLDADQAFTELT